MKRYTSTLLVFLLCGCAIGPDYQSPAVDTSETWKGASASGDLIDATWWTAFNSATLTELVQNSLAYNTDLQAAAQRINQSRAALKIARSPLFPSVSANGSLSRTESDLSSNDTSYRAGVSVAYELDFWKRNANARNAAEYQLQATKYDVDALKLIITSDTAANYFNLLTFKERIALTEESLKVFNDVAEIIDTRFKEGASSGLDVSQQRAAVANAEASLATLKQQYTTTENALAVLMGTPPQQFTQQFSEVLDNITVPEIAPLQPAALLQRRPDIRAQEEGLKAAHANVQIARTNIFPSVTIGATGSVAANALNASPEFALNALASVAQRIFEGGRITGEVELAKAQQEELVANYRTAVLVAFRETENALAQVTAATEREKKLAIAMKESRTSYNIAKDRYMNGADDFITLLDAQRSLLQSQDTYAQANLDRLAAALSLFQALGGGWNAQNEEE